MIWTSKVIECDMEVENGTLLWVRLLILYWRDLRKPFLLTSSLTSCFPVSPCCNAAPHPHHAPMTSTSDRPKPTADWRETMTHSAFVPFSYFGFNTVRKEVNKKKLHFVLHCHSLGLCPTWNCSPEHITLIAKLDTQNRWLHFCNTNIFISAIAKASDK